MYPIPRTFPGNCSAFIAVTARNARCQRYAGSSCIRGDRRAHLFVRQSKEPPNATSQPFRQMQPQGLHQHHLSEVLCDQKAAGAGARAVHHLDNRAVKAVMK